MALLSKPYRALIIGSTGTIGTAFMDLLQADRSCTECIGLSRQSTPPVDYQEPHTIEEAAKTLARSGPFQLIINAIGVLHSENWMPEKQIGRAHV